MIDRIVSVLLIGTLAISGSNPVIKEHNLAAIQNEAGADTTKYGPMKMYWLVFLLKGPNRVHDSATSARIQKAHIANIERLANEGKIVMAGPMGYNKDLRGIFIMNCKDSAEAASYVKTDSAIITGRMRFEIHPWYIATGKYEFK
ncbi:MAG TPA: YciI family protein [Chitinophagaceae bacterium]